jgi:crotonobetainyl-CoA:carnitine CoA-transferase CaiB-like acyl-CoA transferase
MLPPLRQRTPTTRVTSQPTQPPVARPPAGALEGIRVLDLSRVLAGPLCTMILGDLGAEVIKVERPGDGDETRAWGPPWAEGEGGRESAYFLCTNRNKRSVTADLKAEPGRALVRRLAREADVLVENFAPGTLARMGLAYESLGTENPGLVFCSITGYGATGAGAGRPGYDFAVQARAGWMSITGEAEGAPMKTGVALVDVLTGQNAAIAILAALQERSRSGRGQRVEVALLDSAIAGLVNVAQSALVGAVPKRWGNAHATIVPYQSFPAADGEVVVAVGNDAQWRKLCAVLARPDLGDDARFATNPGRVEHRETLVPLLAATLRERTAADWLARLESAGVPCAPVLSVEAALADPAFTGRGGLWPMQAPHFGTVQSVASPLRLERTPPALRRPPPALGEHDDAVERRGWQP